LLNLAPRARIIRAMEKSAGGPTVDGVLAALLAGRKVLKLATAGGKISPWITSAYFVEEGVRALHLILEQGGKGMENIAANPKVAVAIDGDDPFAPFAQAEAFARVLEGDAAAAALARLKGKVPEIAPLLMGPHRVLQLDVSRWRVTSFANGWFPARELVP
jgi:hypothetical protein